jgi:tetratricopeptide (TPR) repeat protein
MAVLTESSPNIPDNWSQVTLPGNNDDNDNSALEADAVYQGLLGHYQKGEWSVCQKLIHELLLRYPGNRRLLEFEADINTQVLLKNIGSRNVKQRQLRNLGSVMLGVIGFLIVGLIGVIFYQSYMDDYERQAADNRLVAEKSRQDNLQSLLDQASLTLKSGNPSEALAILDKLESMSPGFPESADLRITATAQLELLERYNSALAKSDAGDLDDSLELFLSIQKIDANFRDVNYQIERIKRNQSIAALQNEAQKYYLAGEWEASITTYNSLLLLEPSKINAQDVKEQLLYSYLKEIVETLSQDEPSILDLERCGEYYRKAIALIPQDRDYITERENLRLLSVELLVTKYFQIGKSILRDPNQAERSVVLAVDFFNRALDLRPENEEIREELGKAVQYREALVYFNDEKWEQAIPALEKIAKFDSSYPNGMVPILLYEAHAGKGFKYLDAGFYLDAQNAFEKAEILAWGDQENKLRLFEIQVNLGKCFGGVDNYQDAVSYFDYAIKAGLKNSPLANSSDFKDSLAKARVLNAEGKYFEAYEAYLVLLEKPEELLVYTDLTIHSGDNLAFVAQSNQSTIHAIRVKNQVSFPIVDRDQIVAIPTLP